MIDDKEIWNLSTKSHSLKSFIQEVLDKTFPKDRIKREINEDGDKLNIACPYCKDSNKKKSKKRGNIYLSTNTFKCFNDGCMTYAPLTKFISYHCQKFNLSPPDVFLKGDIKETIISKKKSSLLNFLLNKEISNKLISLDYFINRFSLSKIDDFSINSQTVNYIKNERFLNGNHKLLGCCYHDEKMEKLYIFNKDDVSNKILGFSIRNATEDYYGPKYRIYNYTEILREGLASVEFTKIELREIDLLNNYFNILNLNHREPITILEGQFDSMFIKNAMASTGVGKIRDVLLMLNNSDNIKILLDNDKAGKSESLNLIKEGYLVFLWSKFISNLSKKYPSSIKEIKKINDVNDVFKFMKIKDNNITYKDFNNYLDDYYSNSFFDAIFI
jgi:hypothetical protein